MDFDLVGDTEANVGLAYREDPSQAWSVYEWYTLQAGADNGNGTIKVDSLIQGEYAIANIEQIVGLSEEEEESRFEVFPNPSADKVYLSTSTPGNYSIRIIDVSGKSVFEESRFLDRYDPNAIDVSKFASGSFVIQISSASGRYVESLPLLKN